jgi:hypothetical protein
MSAATKLLDCLDRPKQIRAGSWAAGCPCCQSKRGRPLSVRELDDGRVLLHAFCGCSTEAVLGVLGLTLTDLFPERITGSGADQFKPAASRIPARDLLQIISEETSVVAIIAADMIAKKNISDTDWQRLALAASRIGKACNYVR